jgi:hypothetical protein
MMADEEPNEFSVHVRSDERGWAVQIMDPTGAGVWSRACADEQEARTLASTVRQHIYWLSPAKFRDYYRLAQPV